jgi:hypothetical protein
VRNQEAALRGELGTVRAALFTAETELRLKSEEVVQLRVESEDALRAVADGEAARVSATEERNLHEQARKDAEAKCLEMESSLVQEKATMQSLLAAVETKLTDAERQMSATTAEALQNIADQETEARRMRETMDHRLVQASLRRLRRCTLITTLRSWQSCAHRSHEVRKAALRMQQSALATAVRGWHESAARAVRLRIVCTKAIRRMQRTAKLWAFAALWEYRCKRKQRLSEQQDQKLVIEEMCAVHTLVASPLISSYNSDKSLWRAGTI